MRASKDLETQERGARTCAQDDVKSEDDETKRNQTNIYNIKELALATALAHVCVYGVLLYSLAKCDS